ncbi:response regulator [Iodobacter fluviatilis]|uniref:KDP operon transcriptional regulatory protein KdpE n=1 Tax=Iodobacter fluviatilis TaxID=537 RepID=A0A377Q9H3_9NEIS|nr:response regulator [Iodobacter fluviatilis]TCU81925.1 two-component system KDP operon response regulator KdpE [Iodobacter fluviatilis]STQ91542.1 KDP operon transcriptional regulatory protein KdpE [Iodobacter fluviatilis]
MSDIPITVVIIEDEKPIRHFLSESLLDVGMQVFTAETGKQGLIEVATRKPDLIILDLGLPDMDGVTVIERLREWCELPVLVLSARTQETEKVRALDAGADDFLTKPFGVPECLARIRVLLRRHTRGQGAQQSIEFGQIKIDLVNRQVYKSDVPVHLTPIEYRLLTTLTRFPGKVLTHRELLKAVWGPSHSESSQYLRVYMGHLRQKLETDPALPQHIVTETGVGYRLIS